MLWGPQGVQIGKTILTDAKMGRQTGIFNRERACETFLRVI